MPLDAQDPAAAVKLDRLGHAVGGPTRDDQPAAEAVDRLVVVTAAHVALLLERAGGERAGLEVNLLLVALEGADDPAMRRRAVLERQVLVEVAAEGHVEDLHSAADTEVRHAALDRGAGQR